jgi:hypothetical protein
MLVPFSAKMNEKGGWPATLAISNLTALFDQAVFAKSFGKTINRKLQIHQKSRLDPHIAPSSGGGGIPPEG